MNLTANDLHTITCALQVASEIYTADAFKVRTAMTEDLAAGTNEAANLRLIKTLELQGKACDDLLERIENEG